MVSIVWLAVWAATGAAAAEIAPPSRYYVEAANEAGLLAIDVSTVDRTSTFPTAEILWYRPALRSGASKGVRYLIRYDCLDQTYQLAPVTRLDRSRENPFPNSESSKWSPEHAADGTLGSRMFMCEGNASLGDLFIGTAVELRHKYDAALSRSRKDGP